MALLLLFSHLYLMVLPVGAISSPELDDYTVEPGQVLEVSGEDVTAGSIIKIYWSIVREPFSDGVGLLTTTEGNPDGSYEAEITVPATPAGSNYIWVKDMSSSTTAKSAPLQVRPKLTITPHRGLPGNTIDVEGSGFGVEEDEEEDDVEVELRFQNGVNLLLTTSPSTLETNEYGSFTATFQVPDVSEGNYVIRAEDDLGNVDTVDFTIGASITLDDYEGAAGTIIDIEGVGFNPYAIISEGEITMGDEDVPIIGNNIDVENDGEFDGEIIIPSLLEGEYTLNVSDGETWADATFTVTGETAIELSPTSGPPGTSLTVTGYNFTNRDGTDVEIKIGSQTVTGDTDSDGEFSETFNIPALAEGTYTVRATDDNGLEAEASFKVGFIVAFVSPDSGPSGERITITGTGFEPGDFDAWFDEVLVIDDGTVGSSKTVSEPFYAPTIAPGTYTVKVEDEDGNEASDEFEITAVTTLSMSSNQAPIGKTVEFTGLYYSQEEGANLEWVIYNSTWDMDITDDVEYEGDPVEVTEHGNFTGEWEVPEDLHLGMTYTINATDDNGLWGQTLLTIVEKGVTISTQQSTYELEDTITFNIRTTFKEEDAYLRIRAPDGNLYFQATFEDEDWEERGSQWYVPVRAQFDDINGYPFNLPTTAPTGEWQWKLYDSEDDIMNSGSFIVFESGSGDGGDLSQRIATLEATVNGLRTDFNDRTDEIDSVLAEIRDMAEDAQTQTQDLEDKITGIETKAEEAKTAANEARDTTAQLSSTMGELRMIVYAALGAAIVAAAAGIAALARTTQRPTTRPITREPGTSQNQG
jgi:hypothetical protein